MTRPIRIDAFRIFRHGLLAGGIALATTLSIPAFASDPEAGKTKAQTCMNCHGIDGIGLLPNAPNISGQNEIYLIEQLRAYRSGKRHSEVMKVIAVPLSDTDIDDLAAWYSGIEITVTVPE